MEINQAHYLANNNYNNNKMANQLRFVGKVHERFEGKVNSNGGVCCGGDL